MIYYEVRNIELSVNSHEHYLSGCNTTLIVRNPNLWQSNKVAAIWWMLLFWLEMSPKCNFCLFSFHRSIASLWYIKKNFTHWGQYSFFFFNAVVTRLMDKDFIQKRILLTPLDPCHFSVVWAQIASVSAGAC